jgi:solute carrier family 25 (mitochondrial aspartate/glutamate transporter), member 12/13
MPKKDEVYIPLPQKLAVGALAGVFGTSCIFPLDVAKTRLQNQSPDAKTGKLQYRGMLHAFRTIVAKEGFLSLYKGIVPNLIGVTPEKAIKLAANDVFREILMDKESGEVTLQNQILAGAMTGFCQVSATNPMEIVKLRMQLQNLKPLAERQTTMEVVRALGLRGMYKGVAVTWCRDVPYSMIFFPAYASMKSIMSDEHGHAGMGAIMFSGAMAGMSASWLCTPPDVIKTRVQAEGARYNGGLDCLKQTVREEGFTALFKGSIPRAMVTGPLFCLAMLAFEVQKRYIKGEDLF